MNLKDQLQTMASGKNASYSAIADYLLARKSYAGLKLKEVAHACHVSDATVVRFCQNLGFDGFSDLKYNLTNVLQQKWRQFETDLHLCRENPVYFQRVEESCHVTEQLFTREKQEQFLSMLDEVKEIILIGLGTSYLVAKDLRSVLAASACAAVPSKTLYYRNLPSKTPTRILWSSRSAILVPRRPLWKTCG